jgi:hypothetical protein
VAGKNEEELTEVAIPYEIGKACYKQIARVRLPDLGRMLQSGSVRRHQPARHI